MTLGHKPTTPMTKAVRAAQAELAKSKANAVRVKIIQVTEGGAEEFSSVEEWVRHYASSGSPVGVGSRSAMARMVDAMPSGTVAVFGGGWVLKDVKEVEFK